MLTRLNGKQLPEFFIGHLFQASGVVPFWGFTDVRYVNMTKCLNDCFEGFFPAGTGKGNVRMSR